MSPAPPPLFTLRVSAQRCVYDARVNDVTVYRDPRGDAVQTEFPVNHLLRSGRNVLSVLLRPSPGDEALDVRAECVATLRVRPMGADRDAAVVITAVGLGAGAAAAPETQRLDGADGYRASASGDTLVTAPERRSVEGLEVFERAVEGPLPFPLWRWLQSPSIVSDATLLPRLLDVYRHLWALFRARDAAAVTALLQEKNAELAVAFARTPEELRRSSSTEAVLSDPAWELAPLDDPEPRVDLLGGGRLVRLVRADGSPMLSLRRQGSVWSAGLELLLRTDGRSWVITR